MSDRQMRLNWNLQIHCWNCWNCSIARRIREFLHAAVSIFLHLLGNLLHRPIAMAKPVTKRVGTKQLGEGFRLHAFDESDDEGEIFFNDEPAMHAALLRWDPATHPPPILLIYLRLLNYDHEMGIYQTPLRIFYRIFLTRQLSDERANRPRFLTAVRRAYLNSRRMEYRVNCR